MKRVNANILTQYLRVAIASFLIFLFSGIPSIAADKVFFYHTDATGTPMAMTDSNGDVVWEGDYLPFGEEYEIAGEVGNKNRFIGKEKDEETDLYYFGARYLDARAGRFTATDPVGIRESDLMNPQRFNRYAYGLNNPYRYVDPDGEAAIAAFFVYEGIELLIAGMTVIWAGKVAEQYYEKNSWRMYNENTTEEDKNIGENESVKGDYKPAPDELEAFPDTRRTKPKTDVQGGGGKRKRWKDEKGNIYEWDSKKGTVEKYNKTGKKHQGEFDPKSGKQVGKPVKTRRVEP